MTKVLGVEFAPLNIPLQRRIQTVAVLHYLFCFLFSPFFCIALACKLLLSNYWWILVLYGIWYLYDEATPRRGGRPSAWFRDFPIWRHFRDYFPVTLVKTADLDPGKNYIFGCHPHGIMSVGAFTVSGTNALNFSEVFPGLTATILTLVQQFKYPFRREYIMMTGRLTFYGDSPCCLRSTNH